MALVNGKAPGVAAPDTRGVILALALTLTLMSAGTYLLELPLTGPPESGFALRCMLFAIVAFVMSLAAVIATELSTRRWRKLRLAGSIAMGAVIHSAGVSNGWGWIFDHTSGNFSLSPALWFSTGLSYLLVAWIASTLTRLRERYRAECDARMSERDESARLKMLWEEEELQMRRTVADRLHGEVQNRLVLVAASLAHVADGLEAQGASEWVDELRKLAELVDRVCEKDLHALSASVFPDGAEISTVQALRYLLLNLPPHLQAELRVGPSLQRLLDCRYSTLPVRDRLLVVSLAEEAITNAVKHGHATSVTIEADARPSASTLSSVDDEWSETEGETSTWLLDVVIEDDGCGLETQAPGLRGLARHRTRIEARGGRLELTRALATDGARVQVTMPFFPTPPLAQQEREAARN